MATYLIDIDDTLVKHGSKELLPGALETLQALYDRGDMIVLTTYRGDNFSGVYSKGETLKALKELGIKYHEIVWNLPSPRIVINDDGAYAVNHQPAAPISVAEIDNEVQKQEVANKLLGTAKYSYKKNASSPT